MSNEDDAIPTDSNPTPREFDYALVRSIHAKAMKRFHFPACIIDDAEQELYRIILAKLATVPEGVCPSFRLVTLDAIRRLTKWSLRWQKRNALPLSTVGIDDEPLDPEAPGDSDQRADREWLTEFKAEALTPTQQRVYEAVIEQGLPQAQAARLCGMTLGSIRKTIKIIRAKALEDYPE